MSCSRVSVNLMTLEELDKELIRRCAQTQGAPRYPDLDSHSFPDLSKEMERVKDLYKRAQDWPPNKKLAGFSNHKLLRQVMEKVEDSGMGRRAINDKDNRLDYYEIRDPGAKQNADSVAAIFVEHGIRGTKNGKSLLRTKIFGRTFLLCEREPFHHQPIALGRLGTGFLVAKDVIATAGHCVPLERYNDLRIVFGYRLKTQRSRARHVPERDIYRVKKVLDRVFNSKSYGPDWALLQLDRPVEDRPVLSLSPNPVNLDQQIYVLGHPVGLPLKYAPDAHVSASENENYFQADLDVYSGNSGSPVFDAYTHQVVGVVVRGQGGDFRWTGQCWVSVIYANARFRGEGSHCTRVSEFYDRVVQLSSNLT